MHYHSSCARFFRETGSRLQSHAQPWLRLSEYMDYMEFFVQDWKHLLVAVFSLYSCVQNTAVSMSVLCQHERGKWGSQGHVGVVVQSWGSDQFKNDVRVGGWGTGCPENGHWTGSW